MQRTILTLLKPILPTQFDRMVIAQHGWDKLRPINGGIVTSDSYSFGNILPIESIVRVQLRRNFVSSVPGGGEVSADPRIATGTALIDATQYFIDEEIYNLLNAEEQKNYIPLHEVQDNSVHCFIKDYSSLTIS